MKHTKSKTTKYNEDRDDGRIHLGVWMIKVLEREVVFVTDWLYTDDEAVHQGPAFDAYLTNLNVVEYRRMCWLGWGAQVCI